MNFIINLNSNILSRVLYDIFKRFRVIKIKALHNVSKSLDFKNYALRLYSFVKQLRANFQIQAITDFH